MLQHVARSVVPIALMATLAACSGGDGEDQTGGRGGAGGSAGSSGGAAGGTGGAAGTSGDDEGFPSACERQPAARHADGGVLALKVVPRVREQPVKLGEDGIALTDGRVLRFTTIRFFLGTIRLVDETGRVVAADLVDPAGKPSPYGVHLVDLETPSSLELRVRAPAGRYRELRAAVGLAPACNVANPADAVAPLNASGGMTWTWMFGYIFVRLEGKQKGGSAGVDWSPFAAHGGSIPPSTPPPIATATTNVDLPKDGALRTLLVDLDPLLPAIDGPNHLESGFEIMNVLREENPRILRIEAP